MIQGAPEDAVGKTFICADETLDERIKITGILMTSPPSERKGFSFEGRLPYPYGFSEDALLTEVRDETDN